MCLFYLWSFWPVVKGNNLVGWHSRACGVGGGIKGEPHTVEPKDTELWMSVFILMKMRKYFLIHFILQVTYYKFSWPSFTKSSVYKSLFLSELCWKPSLYSRLPASSVYINKIQRDATVCRCLFTAKLLHVFRVSIAPIIRSASNSNCSFWYRL